MDTYDIVLFILQIAVIPGIIGFFVYHYCNKRNKDFFWPYFITFLVVAGTQMVSYMHWNGESLLEGQKLGVLIIGAPVGGFSLLIIAPLSNFLKKKEKNKP